MTNDEEAAVVLVDRRAFLEGVADLAECRRVVRDGPAAASPLEHLAAPIVLEWNVVPPGAAASP